MYGFKKCRIALVFVLMMVLLFISTGIPAAAQEASVEDSLIFGDANGDGEVNSIDYGLLKAYILGTLQNFSYDKAIYTMDVNGDGLINSTDYALLKEFLMGNISTFPVIDVISTLPERVFEYHYQNNAWGAFDDGFYIDYAGNIHFYDNISNQQTVVGNIPKAELQEKYLLLLKASYGKISEKTFQYFDAGSIMYTGHTTSKEVFLKLDGDFLQYNMSPYTQALVDWIKGIRMTYLSKDS